MVRSATWVLKSKYVHVMGLIVGLLVWWGGHHLWRLVGGYLFVVVGVSLVSMREYIMHEGSGLKECETCKGSGWVSHE